MIFFAKLFSYVAAVYLGLSFISLFLRPVRSPHINRMRDYINKDKKEKNKQRAIDIKDKAIKFLSKYVYLSYFKREEFMSYIERLDLKVTPKEIRATQVLYAIIGFLIAMGVYSLNAFLGYITLIGILLGWMLPVDELDKNIQEKNKNIMEDFPVFYSLLYYQYARTVNIYLQDAVRDFLPNANDDMAQELGIFVDNIEFGEVYALKKLKKRVPLRNVIKFCDIMQTRLNGYDNTSQMYHLKNELNNVRLKTLEDELELRAKKNMRTQLILVGILAIYVIIYFYFQFIDAMTLFG